MTFEEYINNPLENRLGGFTRDIYRLGYTERLNKILVRVNNKIDYFLYKDESNGSYFLYIKMPSEVVDNFTYDVVVHFIRPKKDPHSVDTANTLKGYDVEFFSNDPAFVYNLEYTFNSHKMFIQDLVPKASKIALRTKPKETNPNNTVFYCKSIYWAYLIAKERGLFVKSKYIDPYDKKRLLSAIEDSETKIAERQDRGASAKAEKKRKQNEENVRQVLRQNNLDGISFQMKNPDFNTGKGPKSPNLGKVNFAGGKKPSFEVGKSSTKKKRR